MGNMTQWPALTLEEWQGLDRGRPVSCTGVDGDQLIGFAHELDAEGEGIRIEGGSYTASIFEADNVRRLLAIANDALPKNDPRKITRTWIDAIRSCATRLESDLNTRLMSEAVAKTIRTDAMTLHAIADGLESLVR